MSRFHGPMYRGAAREARARRRAEAAARAAPESLLAAVTEASCDYPHLTPYADQGAALAAMRGIARRTGRRGDNYPFRCGGGHYHLGMAPRRKDYLWRAS